MEMMSALRKIYGKTACRERQMSQGRDEGKQKGLMSNCTKHTLFSGENVCLLTKHFHFGLLGILIYYNQHRKHRYWPDPVVCLGCYIWGGIKESGQRECITIFHLFLFLRHSPRNIISNKPVHDKHYKWGRVHGKVRQLRHAQICQLQRLKV